MNLSRHDFGVVFTVLLCVTGMCAPQASAQSPDQMSLPPEDPVSEVPQRVEVESTIEDTDIATRLTRILEATGWFEDPQVRVDEGVVFINGRASDTGHRDWATRLAGNTRGVVAVVNRLEVKETSMWDLSPAWDELRRFGAQAVRELPLLVLALLLLAATWGLTKWTAHSASSLFGRRLDSQLLRDVAARVVAVPVFLFGLYLVLRVSGLTRLAMTVVGGTGVLAIVIGFAFRDIAENFLASVFISIQRPFGRGDLIEVGGYKGYVQSVNTRSTLLMTLEGNHVQIPNSTIFKETITNFTANPNARFDFSVGIGYDDSISTAQSVALAVMRDHPAIINDPEPLVLVESLGAATVNLRIYVWVDISKYSQLKVRSAVIRLTKRAFEQAGISMPDEAREVVFPGGVPVRMVEGGSIQAAQPGLEARVVEDDEAAAHSAEGDLSSEAEEIEQQARQSRPPETGQDLLE